MVHRRVHRHVLHGLENAGSHLRLRGQTLTDGRQQRHIVQGHHSSELTRRGRNAIGVLPIVERDDDGGSGKARSEWRRGRRAMRVAA